MNSALAVTLFYLSASLPGAVAEDCWKDLRGREHCDISPGVRVGLGFAVLGFILAVFFLIKYLYARRSRRKNLARIPSTPAQMEAATGIPPPAPASILRRPDPVYELHTPPLPYLPGQPPAYVREPQAPEWLDEEGVPQAPSPAQEPPSTQKR